MTLLVKYLFLLFFLKLNLEIKLTAEFNNSR